MDIFIQQIINGLVLGSVYALVALGYTMVYGIINLINFAHGDVLMVGALTSWTVVTLLADSGLPGWALLLISLAAAVVVCAAPDRVFATISAAASAHCSRSWSARSRPRLRSPMRLRYWRRRARRAAQSQARSPGSHR